MRRPQSERTRTLACIVIGLVVGAALAPVGVWELAVTGGWIAAAGSMLGWIWGEVHALAGDETARIARIEDDSRASSRGAAVAACVVSLIAVVATLHRANVTNGALSYVLTGCAMGAVVMSWALIHSQYTLRYAHIYYDHCPPKGITFPGEESPSFRDFAYVAFGIGMCFQVADNNIDTARMRAAVLGHALLSYLFGVAIIGATINVLAGLI